MGNHIDRIADTLDDIATTLAEMQEHCGADGATLDRMRQSIERATDAIDRLANNEAGPPFTPVADPGAPAE